MKDTAEQREQSLNFTNLPQKLTLDQETVIINISRNPKEPLRKPSLWKRFIDFWWVK